MSSTTTLVDPIAVVEDFLDALRRLDVDTAAAHLTRDAVWHNVGLPRIVGRAAVVAALHRMARLPRARFTVELHNIASHGATVLTERTDGLWTGPLGGEFWVCGTFELRGDRIAVWRDRFDTVDVVRGTARGTAGGLLRLLTSR